jgi:hypothetical protein
VIKLNPLWVGLLEISLGQTTAAFAASGPIMTALSSSVQRLSPASQATPDPLLAQAATVPAKGSQNLAVKSFARLVERYRCATPAAQQSLSGQPTNRYEMAALLASCLESLGDRTLDPQEQSTLTTLRSEFRLELAALQEEGQTESIRIQQPIESHSAIQQPTYSFIKWSSPSSQDTPHQGGTAQPLLGIKAEATLGKVGLFGRYSVASRLSGVSNGAELMGRALGLASELEDRSLQTWSAGIGIRGFIIPKSVLALSAGRTLVNSFGQPSPVNYSAFYQFPVGDHLTLSPSIVIINNPSNPGTPDIQGAVQASFSF